MNWNKDKSLKFTRVCIYFFAVLLVGICVGAPWLYRGFLELRSPLLDGMLPYFLVTNYATAVPVGAALYKMNGLLKNISANQVFISENTERLRQLSWCCAAAGMIFAASRFLLFSVLVFMRGSYVYGFDTACDKECFCTGGRN